MLTTSLSLLVALGFAAASALARDVPPTEHMAGKEAEITLAGILAPKYMPLPSIRLDGCASHVRTLKYRHPRRFQDVRGCALRIDAADFAKLISYIGDMPEHRSATSISPNIPVPLVGPPFPLSDAYYVSPPEHWNRNDVLLYTNRTKTRVVIYAHYLVVE